MQSRLSKRTAMVRTVDVVRERVRVSIIAGVWPWFCFVDIIFLLRIYVQ